MTVKIALCRNEERERERDRERERGKRGKKQYRLKRQSVIFCDVSGIDCVLAEIPLSASTRQGKYCFWC